jgi:4a-hydroxytetrahydrobiopterin dehydratase
MTEWISPNQFLEAEGVEDWRVLNDGVSAYFATGKFAAGALLALAIGDLTVSALASRTSMFGTTVSP